ncbi:MAG: Txe/YoeB family addiction module toxin [Actinomycetota bacterium]|nr:Txe/YoeB family addiction module toxin [Actinomycetota bacterium]
MIKFTPEGWGDYPSWSGDRKSLRRINRLIGEATRDPAVGAGKPERLKGNLTGHWSRRINQEHRLVYTVDAHGHLVVIQARHRY